MTDSADAPASANDWAQILKHYREPNHARSIVEIIITLVPFMATWALSYAAIHFGYWLALLVLWPLGALLLVRLFLIQHDCGHGTFFRNRGVNDWIGRVLGALTLTPYDIWRHDHAVHHSTAGHLERRGIGDIDTLTVREFEALTFWGRLRYRAYRHPLVLFGIGPAYMFILRHRLPYGFTKQNLHGWTSIIATNLGIAGLALMMIWLVGLVPFLLIQLPFTALASSIGVWLFYVQHQFEDTVWAHGEDWNLREAALHGSSHYDLPAVLRWFTANIGVHHVHHLCSHIPYYRLGTVLRDHPQLRDMGRLTFTESLRCVRFHLWDEARQKMVSFREAAVPA